MTIKLISERSGFGRRFEKRINRGPTLKFYCRPKAQEKQHFGKSQFLSSIFPRKSSDNHFEQLPPLHPPGGRTRGLLRIRELLSERMLVILAPPTQRTLPY